MNEKNQEKLKLLQPKNDFVFQSLFSEKNKEITKEFVSALLNEKIENMTINNTKELFREYPTDKLGILDLEADVNGREKVDIEVQMVKKEDFIDRLLFYFSKLYAMQIGKGDNYNISKRVVLIAIIDYELDITKEIEEMETKWKLRNSKNLRTVLTDKIEIDIIELKKVRNTYNKNKKDKKSQWMMFMNNPEDEEVDDIMKENEGIKEAKIEVVKMSSDEKMRKLAELREKAIRDEKSCYNTGLHEGEKKATIKIAKELLKKGMNVDEISQITSLTVEEIEKLK